MAQTGIAIEQLATVGTPSPVAALFQSKSAANGAAQQPRAVAPAAAKASAPASVGVAGADGALPTPPVQAVIVAINASFLAAGRSLELSVDAQSDRSVVILRDTETGVVIGQFPTEQVLHLQTLLGTDPPHALIDFKA